MTTKPIAAVPAKERTVTVTGTVEVRWTVEIPKQHEWDGQACTDPAVEAVICSGVSGEYDIYLFGEDKPPVNVYLDVGEDDVTIEDDDRDPQ